MSLPLISPEAAFVSIGEDRYVASGLTRGPWHPDQQHAGPPIALVVHGMLAAARPHGLLHMGRLTANLLRPVPIGELELQIRADYVGRNTGHFSACVMAQGKEVIRATALLQREEEVALPADLPGHPLPKMAVGPAHSRPQRMQFANQDIGYPDLVETREASGSMFQGPSAVWFRLRHPLVQGADTSPYERVAAAADSGNGISAVLDLQAYLFVNSDLTINLLRRPVGEWICVEARTLLSPQGGGLAESALYDIDGLVGRATQSLFVRRR